MSVYYDGFFLANDGCRLYQRRWGEARQGVVVLIHGFGEHVGRYRFLVKMLVDNGYEVFSYDARGHGRSEGPRGHIDSFQEYIQDLHVFLQLVRDRIDPNKPLFLLGHSQGGHKVLRYGIQYPHTPLQGIIASSPFLGMGKSISLGLRSLARAMSVLRPSFSNPAGLNIADLSHDQTIIEETRKDTLYSNKASARWYTETVKAHTETLKAAPRLHFPLLLQMAGEERVVSKEAVFRFFEQVGSLNKRLIEYPGYFHEVYNETPDRRGPVFADLRAWMKEHSPQD